MHPHKHRDKKDPIEDDDFFSWKKTVLQLLLIAIPVAQIAYEIVTNAKNEALWFKLIVSAELIVALYCFVSLMNTLRLYIAVNYPENTVFEKKPALIDKVLYHTSTGFMVVGMVLLLFQIRPIDNTIHGMGLFWKYAGLGILAGIIVLLLLPVISRTLYATAARKLSIVVCILVGSFLFTPALASILNRKLSKATSECGKHFILRKGASNGKHTAYFIFCILDGSEERLDIPWKLWDELDESGQVCLCIRKGWLGYDFVEKIQPVDLQ
jgi:hypothetical protein